MFSSRLPTALEPNAISRAVSALRAANVPLLDLTETNPTLVGLAYPAGVLEALAAPDAMTYAPESLGLGLAREAVAQEYGRAGHRVNADSVVLTASTSEAYTLLFKLLCDPGDDVLVPQPSYPLFESLTRLDAVAVRPYRLEYHGAWSIDRESVTRAFTGRTRALLVVSPNNPTGSMLRRDDREWLVDQCARRGVAIISDEVFAEYPLRPGRDAVSMMDDSRALTFVLGGLSKSAGLPQVKLGWMVVNGPAAEAAAAIERLDVICDTYLSVSTPVQVAAPALLAAGRDIRASILQRLTTNLDTLNRLVGVDSPVSVLQPEGGWSVALRVPATQPEEAMVLRLLAEARTVVHPGFFFDFADEAFLVVSLLPEAGVFEEAVRRMLPIVAAAGGRVA
jgi:aspartate/methionine/tyrosine aminotransferase